MTEPETSAPAGPTGSTGPISGPDLGPTSATTSGRKPRSARQWVLLAVLSLVALLLALAVAVVGVGAWVWNSDSAQQRALQHVPGLTLEAPRGRLNGGAFGAERLRWESPDLVVEIDDLRWADAQWRWRPYAGAWVGLKLAQPQASSVRVTRKPLGAKASEPMNPPSSLKLPLEAVLQGLRLGSLQLDGETLLTALEADVHLGADSGARHRIDNLALTRELPRAQTPATLQLKGRASIGTEGDLPLSANLEIQTPPGTPQSWRAALQVLGPLQRLGLNATLSTESGAGATATATATPFAEWPLAALALQTQELDLSLLAPGLPETRLSGTATLADVTAGEPLRMRLALDNAAPGPWDAGRLPLRSVRGNLQGRPSERDRLAFDGLVVELGRNANGGRVSGSGQWQAAQLDLQLKLEGVQAVQLDTRAPAATLDGSVELALQGLALPGGEAAAGAAGGAAAAGAAGGAAAAGAAGGAAAASAAGAAGAAAPAAPRGLEGRVQIQLRGRLPALAKGLRPPPPLDLNGEARFEVPADATLAFDLKRFEASSGKARASGTLQARRDAGGDWAVKSGGTLQSFDLAAWWPAATAGRSSNLNGTWDADLQLPAGAAAGTSAAVSTGPSAGGLMDTLRGAADLTLKASTLAGVPLSGTAALQARGRGLRLEADLQVAANTLRLNGGIAAGLHDWRAEVDAPALSALAPLLKLVPAAQGYAPSAGTLQASATANGRWPALRSEGRLQLGALRTPQLQLEQGSVQWSFNGTALDAPLTLDADLTGVAQAERRLDRLQARLEGSLRNHRLTLNAASALRPPAWTDALAGPPARAEALAGAKPAAPAAPPGSSLNLQLQGRWQPASNAASATLGAGEWRGTVLQLRAAPRAEGSVPWLSARDLQAQFSLNSVGQPQQALLAPGRIELFGGALSWQQARWRAADRAGAPPEIALEARLEPLQVAPFLARLQPGMGWGGDLSLSARASVHSAARFDADIVVERGGGDLALNVAGTTRQLGLSQLRVTLGAHNGRWQVTQALAGSAIGVLSGTQTIIAPLDAVVPPAQAPLQGGVQLRVADVGVWAAWLPPGWRLGGELQASAVLGGTVGTPTYHGTVTGDRLLVRNIFEGINLKEGTVRVALNRSEAVIESIDFKGAAGGTLHVEGRAGLSGQPQLALKVVTDHFRALDRVDRRVALSGSADVGLRAGRLSVNGRFTVDEGLIDVSAADAPSLDKDILVVGRTDAAGKPIAVVDGGKGPPTGVMAGADIDLRVALGDALQLRGRGLDTRLRGQLRITTTPAGELAVRGVVNTVEGTYSAYGQNLAIERGTITFAGNVANPRLDILALRADIDTRVGVIVSGSAVAPRVRLYSDPDLPQIDQITWLLTGREPQGEGRDQSALLQRAALALLAGDQGSSSEGFLQKLGIDQFGVGRTEGGDTLITVGKQLSKRLSVAYEKGLAAAGGTWQLLYRVAGRTTLRARAGAENAVDVIWSWRWD